MIGTFLAGIGGKILMAMMAAGLIVGGYFYWQHVVASRALIAAQRDALIELAKRQEATIAEKAARDAEMRRLPDERVRLCAILPKPTGCCTETGPCPELKP